MIIHIVLAVTTVFLWAPDYVNTIPLFLVIAKNEAVSQLLPCTELMWPNLQQASMAMS